MPVDNHSDRMKILSGQFTAKSHSVLNISTCTKSEIRSSFENAYDLNDSLFTALNDDSVFIKCPDRLRLPLIFYYAHTAVVYVNKLKLAGLWKERINLEFETMFETGVDEFSWDDTENYRMGGSYVWPSVDEVAQYRRLVRDEILKIIDETPLVLPITMDSPWWAILMGIDHERIHIETSSVLIRQLPVSLVHRPELFQYAPVKHGNGVRKNPMVKVKGGDVVYGKPFDYPTYGWDNEYGRAEANVPDFECSKHLITNREFLAFVHDQGYENKDLWSKEGWEWVQFKQARHPIFWVCQKGCKSGCGADLSGYSHCQNSAENDSIEPEVNDKVSTNGRREFRNGYRNGHPNGDTTTFYDHQEKFRYRAMFDVLDMPFDWPVEVNYHEAKAYCRWMGKEYRLPTEAEYQCIRGTRNTYSTVDRVFMEDDKANLNLKYFSSSPVNMFPANEAGFTDSHGNVWQWVEDDFNGLPGFKTNHFYEDFSIPQFRGEHSVILGGSWISTGDEASTFARYAFRRHFFQHAGFRVCRNTQKGAVKIPVRLVTAKEFSSEDREMSFDTKKYKYNMVQTENPLNLEEAPSHVTETLSFDYSSRSSLAQTCYMMMTPLPREEMLLIGCETGRLAFDFSQFFNKVIAVDFNGAYLAICETMLKEGIVEDIKRPSCAIPNRITFKQFTWLPNEVGQHNLVVFNSIDRVLNPKAYAVRFPELVLPGGLLVIVTRKDWHGQKLHLLLGKHFDEKNTFNDKNDAVVTTLVRTNVD